MTKELVFMDGAFDTDSTSSVIFEQKIIRVPFGSNSKEKLILTHIKELQEKIKILELQQKQAILLRHTDDDEARREIILLLKNAKEKKGNAQISVMFISSELKLPANQVQRVMDKLEQEGIIIEEDG